MKQAVILIHGIGEQVPMDTLRGFVDAVWTKDTSVHRPGVPGQVWSKPDDASGDFELRRLTTSVNRHNQRTDFFEFYWAHLMEGTKVGHVMAWAKLLLLRTPSRVPEQLRGLWYFLVLGSIAIAIALIFLWAFGKPETAGTRSFIVSAGMVAWTLFGAILVQRVIGDAARYLHVAPANIESRRRIREAGVKLLAALHRSGKYDRIVVVGHSLGTVIGYDVLSCYWARCHQDFRGRDVNQPTEKLEKLEELARRAREEEVRASNEGRKPRLGPEFTSAYQLAQSEYFRELRELGHPWLVTDFVTMGSPLTHAAILLAQDSEKLRLKKDQREFPTCPPLLEEISVEAGQKELKFTYQQGSQWIPHHAAAFAATRWTNLYFPCRWTIDGDVIGGPVAPQFGCGVFDVPVQTELQSGLLTHTLYWTFPEPRPSATPSWIEKLRQSVRVCSGD